MEQEKSESNKNEQISQNQSNQSNIEEKLLNQPKGATIYQIEQQWKLFAESYSQNFDQNVISFALTLLNMLKIESAESILEVACGCGNILPIALSRKRPEAKYYATDLSNEMLAYTKYRIEQLIINPFRTIITFPKNLDPFQQEVTFDQFNLYLQKANSENLDKFNDNTIEVYFSNLCLHLTEDAMKMLKESYRVLKIGGRAGFTVNGLIENCSFQNVINSAMIKNNIKQNQMRSMNYLGNKDDLIKMMELSGFKNIISWYQFIPFPYVKPEDAYKIAEVAQVKGVINSLPLEQQENFKKDLLDALKQFLIDNKEPVGMQALLIIGEK